MAPLAIRRATKSFGGFEVLHGIDIDIEDGEFVVLVGPSGCGKSTLLRLIAGLEDITTGEILIDDKEVSRLHPKDRDIAMVFQSYALYPHMSVAENMGFSLRMRDVKPPERDRKVQAAAEILGLTPLLDRYPRQLSGGQRQRVAMGRAIVRDPKVFLFDEPLSNLDAKLRVQMRAEIRVLHKKLKTTIVYVTHDQIEAMTMADKIVVLRDGHVEQIGSPLELYDTPANAFVGGFIGSPAMNMLNGRIGEGGRSFVTDNGAELPLAAPPRIEPGRATIMGLRPEDIEIDEAGFPAQVQLIEPTGADIHVNLEVSGDVLTAVFHERLGLSEGQSVRLSIPVDKVHFFDPDSGDRIVG
ncbi:carbohydrate ABC transporter ATP-binding protein, CUT1 family (TC 3.A.1.1.-) [Palleronia marisminoris]|uniref:sn-glycerol-3-phosphate import ATP-binding protein UgpC n=1 Tax=Palleronia marisminoris TaxID=315423 RepID=A0A1Y5TP53_9RHOB|nr:sn-glycerol-3-phosphate ABC transporter ATP-binding protein UgpC [Palleronia marisminoris]SFH46129.1 carbohydrate ABC transporter ATP-binding protein, CUT1 family (TC 3.A.1.1.-) [Palleronia marisminoris]SLN68242.1 sn-glycerol-3-phosphate import ATP-binding protein UgpC [Palleronia marisminoris]